MVDDVRDARDLKKAWIPAIDAPKEGTG